MSVAINGGTQKMNAINANSAITAGVSASVQQQPTQQAAATPAVSTPVKKDSSDIFMTAFLSSIEPYLSALDNAPDGLFDDGRDTRSQTDVGVRIELGQTLSFYHRQLNGPIKTASGGNIRCAREMLELAEADINKLSEELADPEASTTMNINVQKRLDKALYWFGVNEAKVTHYENMINMYSTIYRHITGEDWKPIEVKQPESAYDKMDDEQKAAAQKAALEQLAIVKARLGHK